MKMLHVVVLILGFCLLICSTSLAAPTAKLTIRVINEQGEPISGAQIYIPFETPKSNLWGTNTTSVRGTTDSKGVYAAENESIQGVGFSADKEGYYQTSSGYEFKSSSLLLNRWEPWNPTIEVVLKKKRNPVPMCVGGMDWAAIPTLDQPVGFDLEQDDWVVPYGKGITADLIFTFNSTQRAWTDYESSYTLRFANEKDGIQEFVFDKKNQSLYRWPFEAPESGYLPTLQKYRNDSPATNLQTNEKKDINYIFRVRTKTDKNGNIVAANYGKISGEIRIVPGKIQLFYTFNPDGTRNLEEDPNRNLFKKK